MEVKKIVTFTIANSLTLLIFAGLLASCQKNKFPKTGHFSKAKTTSRSIASVRPSHTKDFLSYQDPKQIVMFCLVNSKKPETCYNINFKEKLAAFNKKAKFQKTKLNEITTELSYKNQFHSLNTMAQNSINEFNEHFKSITSKRKIFCEKNSKRNLEKCLNQYLKRDTFTILNKYQNKNKLNALEYVFMIEKIENKLVHSFKSASLEIQKTRR